MTPLRHHILTTHRQDLATVEKADDQLLDDWHRWEHDPRYGRADHAHDEFTARRRDVPCEPPATLFDHPAEQIDIVTTGGLL